MTNLEKMNELVNENSSKIDIVGWAHMNRIWVVDVPYRPEFAGGEGTVE